MKRGKQQTSSAAVLSVGAELSRRGYDVTFTLGNIYEIRPRKDRRGFDLISDQLP
jgi:uncharacterized protein (DUF58 family)